MISKSEHMDFSEKSWDTTDFLPTETPNFSVIIWGFTWDMVVLWGIQPPDPPRDQKGHGESHAGTGGGMGYNLEKSPDTLW